MPLEKDQIYVSITNVIKNGKTSTK